jgi:hypothetical protein
MRMIFTATMACVLVAGAARGGETDCPPVGDADTHPTFDASLLKEGRFTYRTTRKGESLGDTVIEIRRAGAQFVISMSAPEIAQSWKATVARSFAPVSASLAMRGRKGPYSMNLEYAGAKITGSETEAGVTRPVSAAAEGLLLVQRVDWAAMMAAVAPARSSLVVRVFDPATGASPMLGRIGSAQGDSLRLDYTLCKRDHLEAYTVYATRETPRYMLREDMPNGLVSELIRVEP